MFQPIIKQWYIKLYIYILYFICININKYCVIYIILYIYIDVQQLMYQKFGFKAEEFNMNFYEKYLPADSMECKNAFLLRLRR